MELDINFIEIIKDWIPTFGTIVFFILVYLAVKYLLIRQAKGNNDTSMVRSIILFSIALIGVIAIILAIPMPADVKGQITSLIGIVISAVLALSSATFIGNALAGIMIRAINNFKPGDFITVGDHFGRVSERGLFHTEIQMENRDLTTLPNLFLATNPVRVTRGSGTFISGEVSLGYDVSRVKVETLLKEAAKMAGLEEPFVYITGLGDFSVVYKIHGLLPEVKTILTVRSKLNAMILDVLHNAGIEIMSPTFVGQRQVNEITYIPKKLKAKEIQKLEEDQKQGNMPEQIMFDKADEAESIEKRKESIEEIDQKIKALNDALNKDIDAGEVSEINKKIESWKNIKQRLIDRVDRQLDEIDKE